MAEVRGTNGTSRPRKKKKRKKKRYFLKFCIFVALCVGMYYFFTSDIFDIQKIKVENNAYYTVEQVVEMSGLKTGKNIFKVSVRNAKQKLLKDPYIKNVNVHRRLPGKVIIDVEERKEYAAVPSGETYILIDEDGLVLRKTKTAPALPLIVGMTVDKAQPGKSLKVENNASLTDTLALLGETGDNEIYFKKIDISSIIIKAYIYDYLTCEGTAENIRNGMGGLSKLLKKLYDQGVERGVVKIGSDGYLFFSPEIS